MLFFLFSPNLKVLAPHKNKGFKMYFRRKARRRRENFHVLCSFIDFFLQVWHFLVLKRSPDTFWYPKSRRVFGTQILDGVLFGTQNLGSRPIWVPFSTHLGTKINTGYWGESVFFAEKKTVEISKIEDCSELSESLALIFSGIEVLMCSASWQS